MTLAPRSLRTACRDSHPLPGAIPAAGQSPFRGILRTGKACGLPDVTGRASPCRGLRQTPGEAGSAAFLKRIALTVWVTGALALAGCSSVGGITGAVAGVASGSATANPAVGVAVGIAVKAGVDFTINTVLRSWSHDEQMRIAALVGVMAVGERQAWEIKHEIPYDNKQGHVTVVRSFSSALAECKEALFSVDPGDTKKVAPHFVTTICAGTNGWRWAQAEPAVARWGALQ